jgi:hypothetical protein
MTADPTTTARRPRPLYWVLAGCDLSIGMEGRRPLVACRYPYGMGTQATRVPGAAGHAPLPWSSAQRGGVGQVHSLRRLRAYPLSSLWPA